MRRGSEASIVISDLKHFLFDPLVRGVGSASRFVLHSSVNIYHLARHGTTTTTVPAATTKPSPQSTSFGWVPELAPHVNTAAPPTAARALSEPFPQGRLTASQQLWQEYDARLLAQAKQMHNKLRKLSKAQETASRQRMATLQHRHGFVDSMHFFSETVPALMSVLDELVLDQNSHPELDRLLAQLKDDHSNLRARSLALVEHDIALIGLDHALESRSSKFTDTARAFVSVAGLQTGDARRSSANSETSSSDRSPSPAPSLLAQFLDRRGDINVYRERLGDLDFEHAEERLMREIRKDRDEDLEIPDADFEAAFWLEREEILRDLQSAIDDTDQLELACQQNNIDTSLMRRQSSEVSESETEQHPSLDEPFVVVSRTDAAPGSSTVSNWVQQIPSPYDDQEIPPDMSLSSLRRLEEAEPSQPQARDISWSPSTPHRTTTF